MNGDGILWVAEFDIDSYDRDRYPYHIDHLKISLEINSRAVLNKRKTSWVPIFVGSYDDCSKYIDWIAKNREIEGGTFKDKIKYLVSKYAESNNISIFDTYCLLYKNCTFLNIDDIRAKAKERKMLVIDYLDGTSDLEQIYDIIKNMTTI